MFIHREESRLSTLHLYKITIKRHQFLGSTGAGPDNSCKKIKVKKKNPNRHVVHLNMPKLLHPFVLEAHIYLTEMQIHAIRKWEQNMVVANHYALKRKKVRFIMNHSNQ